MLYLIYIAEGEHKTAHYAIGTGFMALGHDDSGNACRMDTGAYRIHEFLYLGMYMYDSRYHSVINDPQSTGRFIRKKNIEQNYL